MPRRRRILDDIADLDRAIADHESEIERLGIASGGATFDGGRRRRRRPGAEDMTSMSDDLMPPRIK